MGKGELEKRELDRRKQRFRTSPFMCDTPVVTYMDYLIKEKGSSENSDQASIKCDQKEEHDTRPKRRRTKIIFLEDEEAPGNVDRDARRRELDEYLKSNKAQPSYIREIEVLFKDRDCIVIDEKVIRDFFGLQNKEDAFEKELQIESKVFGRWYPAFVQCVEKYYSGKSALSERDKLRRDLFVLAIAVEIKADLEQSTEEEQVATLHLYLITFSAGIRWLINYASCVLPDEQWYVFRTCCKWMVKKLYGTRKESALSALKLNSLKKAMQYFGGYCLYRSSHAIDVVHRLVEVSGELVCPDLCEENLNGVKNWEDIRGIESPVFHSFKKAKLKEAERLIHSYFGNTLFLSDKSILDVSAAYNFLNAKDDHLKFANRTNSGHKAYSAQRYVRNWIKFEDGLHNKRVKELDVIKESAQRVGINLNTEMLAAQRVFLMYRYELQNVLDGERERRLEASRLGDYCARAIGKTILRYDIKAAVDACADALQMCMDVFRDLRMSGCLNKNVSSDSAEIPKDLFKNK